MGFLYGGKPVVWVLEREEVGLDLCVKRVCVKDNEVMTGILYAI